VIWILVAIIVGSALLSLLLLLLCLSRSSQSSMLAVLLETRHIEEDRIRAQGSEPP
jgi:hypothetical protein